MLGAIIGDIVGSRWEFAPTNDYDFELFSDKNSYTDDTICTVAIADAILKGKDYGESLREWCSRYPYPMGGYGARFGQWVRSDSPSPYHSYGNGSAMRVSPIGMYFRNGDDVLEQAALSAACTHDHPIGINGAKAVAWAIHCAIDSADGLVPPKKLHDEIIDIVVCSASDNGFASSVNLEDYKNRFDETCQGTIPPALEIISQSHSFEDAIRRAVSLGADADTIGAIVGSIAEHLWGIPQWMKQIALSYLPEDMRTVVNDFYKACEEQPDYKPKDKELRHQEAIMLWKLGLGHMGKYMNGEDPAPSKAVKATQEGWKLEPMPNEGFSRIHINMKLGESEMSILRQGHIPESQEDHWYMYCDDEHIRYYRSWTGTCAFEARYSYADKAYTITELTVNHALMEFGVNGDLPAVALFVYLIQAEVHGYAPEAWDAYIEAWKSRKIKDIEMTEEMEKENNNIREAISKCNHIEATLVNDSRDPRTFERITPAKIDKLAPGEIFVFGSNKDGHHMGGAAFAASERFGAVWGQGDGLQGQSYAISSMEGLTEMARNVNRFIDFAFEHQELKFLVTPIGCGIAGYKPSQIAPLFRKAILVPNVTLPASFWDYYRSTQP